ncbi:nucleotidyl transferase AbiEii/AbiGii toxin family protein [Mycobacterium haemophilum]
MTRITEGHLTRHYQGVRGGRDAALLDIAQDHALHLLHHAGLFARGLVFKGGTALRKFRAGNAGRFSTDLDFAAPDEEVALAALQALDGVEVDGFIFAIENLGDDGRRGDLLVDNPFGRPQLSAKVELARHALSLAPEKLARYRRVSLGPMQRTRPSRGGDGTRVFSGAHVNHESRSGKPIPTE